MGIDFAADITANLFDTDAFAFEAVYTPRGGTAIPCTVQKEERTVVLSGEMGEQAVMAVVITFDRSEISVPTVRGTVVIGDETYALEALINDETDQFTSAWTAAKL